MKIEWSTSRKYVTKDKTFLTCIDPETDILKFGDGIPELTYGKEYEIISWYDIKDDGRQYISIRNDKGVSNDYLISRFITRENFIQLERDKKLNNLLKL